MENPARRVGGPPSVSDVPSGTARSALVVTVPEAEPVVGDLRLRLDPVAAQGVPAHVTVLFPFVPARELDDDVLRRFAAVVADEDPFGYRFARTAWFDYRVLWLAPEDDRPFRELTGCIHAAFPAFPPFEGVFDDVVPHLTVGVDRPVAELQQAEADVRRRRPVAAARELPARRPQPPVMVSTSSCAVDVDSNSAPTWSRVPRSGSIVGMRTRFSRPRSNTTESHDAAATWAG